MGRQGFTGFSLILAASLISIASAGCRNRAPAADPAGSFTPTGAEMSRTLAIYSDSERVGNLRVSRVKGNWKGEEGAVRLKEEVDLRLSFRGERFRVSSGQVSWIGQDMGLLASEGTMDMGSGEWETKIMRTGKGIYEREQSVSGSGSRDRLVVPEGVMVSDVLPLYLDGLKLKKGQKVKVKVYSLNIDHTYPVTIEYGGETPEGTLYDVRYWGMEEKLWLDDAGMVVSEDMALGVSARKPESKGPEGFLPLEKVLSMSAVPGSGIPGDLADRDRAVLVLEGSFRPPPRSRWQQVTTRGKETTVVLARPEVPPPGRRQPDPALMPADTTGLNLGSERIQTLAASIAGSIQDPWEKALAIGKWVNEKLGKSMKECFSAIQVLEAGEGECQSHSLLMVALARSAGLPARFAYGVVYMPDRGTFGFHTWVQVHVGDWIPMDPTLGDFPAGVDHLTLAVGGYKDQFRLFPYIMGKGGWRIKMQDTGRPSTGLGTGRTQEEENQEEGRGNRE